MKMIKVLYDRGWFAGLLSYPVEFTAEAIVFYDRRKDKTFSLDYKYIKFSHIAYQLTNFVQVELWLKTNPLNDIDKEKSDEVMQWFPPSSGTGFQLLGNKGVLLYINFQTPFKYAKEIDSLLLSRNIDVRVSPFRKIDINKINSGLTLILAILTTNVSNTDNYRLPISASHYRLTASLSCRIIAPNQQLLPS
jgi:hypothetical protein